jgi:hypothetical protein
VGNAQFQTAEQAIMLPTWRKVTHTPTPEAGALPWRSPQSFGQEKSSWNTDLPSVAFPRTTRDLLSGVNDGPECNVEVAEKPALCTSCAARLAL